jgi:hypothetical protein
VKKFAIATAVFAVGITLVGIGFQSKPALAASTSFVVPGSHSYGPVPAGVSYLIFNVYGAAGAPGLASRDATGLGGAGGTGGHTQAALLVNEGDTFVLNVGGAGTLDVGGSSADSNGGDGSVATQCISNGGGGGGASDVRASGGTLADRLIVAGAGGGGGGGIGQNDSECNGGEASGNGGGGGRGAGGTEGARGAGGSAGAVGGEGGDDGAAGSGGDSDQAEEIANDGEDGVGPVGGNGAEDLFTIAGGGGGGGGYHGGGGGGAGYPGAGGGGGSGFVQEGLIAITLEDGVRSGNGKIVVTEIPTPTTTTTTTSTTTTTTPPPPPTTTTPPPPPTTTTSSAPSTTSTTIGRPAVTVTSPNGGEVWARGTSKTITWSYLRANGRTLKIVLLRNGTVVKTLATARPIGTGGTGSLPWTVPTDLTVSNLYKIKLTINGTSPLVVDSSNANFRIS